MNLLLQFGANKQPVGWIESGFRSESRLGCRRIEESFGNQQNFNQQLFQNGEYATYRIMRECKAYLSIISENVCSNAISRHSFIQIIVMIYKLQSFQYRFPYIFLTKFHRNIRTTLHERPLIGFLKQFGEFNFYPYQPLIS